MVGAPINLDLDALRTLVTGMDLGSFAKAADRLGRSPSAISLQLRKLEDQAGQPLLRKQGRGLALTEAGETLIAYARRILELNDEAQLALRDLAGLEGWVRVGVPQDFADTWLPSLLARFQRAYPGTRVEARVDRGSALAEGVGSGALDVALTWGGFGRTDGVVLAERRLAWIVGPHDRSDRSEPIPLVAFDAPCAFRSQAVQALSEAGIAWRHLFATTSLSGLWAAVHAGLGVTVRLEDAVPDVLRRAGPGDGLPELGSLDLVLHRVSGLSKAASAFTDLLVSAAKDPAGIGLR